MNSGDQKRDFKFLVPLFLYFIWAVLRFSVMTKIRHAVFHGIEVSGNEQILLSHLFIVVEAILLMIPYLIFQKMGWVQKISLVGEQKQSLSLGVIGGIVLFFTVVPVAFYFGMKFAPQFSWAGGVGNLFSNAAEETLYRGVLLVSILSVFRKSWLAIACSALAFGVGHWDYPYLFQGYIVFVGLILGALYVRTKGLLTPYVAHMLADLLADSLFH